MAVPQGVWGIDIGQCALKALRVEVVDGQLVATAFDYVEHPKILSQPDADPDQLTREALEQFLSRNHLKGDLVVIGVPGQSGLARFVKLPPVEEKKIGDIVRFEAKQQIPFPLDEVVWDFQKIGAGEVTDGFALETEIGLFAMKRDMIARALTQYQEVGVEVDVVQMAPLALCNFLAYEMLGKGGKETAAAEEDDTPRGKRKCVVGLDIGADGSNLVVTDGEKVIWQRPIPLGGNHLTRALSKELKLTFAKAEHLKRNAAKSPPELKTILAALKPVLTDLVGEVQRSLGYFMNSHREAHVAYLVGLGSAFRLPGLQKYLSEKLQLEVKKPAKFARLGGDEVPNSPVFNENLLSFAVCYGLAAQGAKVGKLSTNLLPPEIRQERLIRAKKPWALAAAVMLFLGAAVLTGGYALNYKSVTAKPIEDGKKQADTVLAAATARAAEVTAKQAELKSTEAAVLSIVAGREEQLNWLKLNKYVNDCLPRLESRMRDGKWTLDSLNTMELAGDKPKPGGKAGENGKPPEMEPDQRKYWMLDRAQEAWREYEARVRGSEPAHSPMPDELREYLPRVDIESIHTYYSPNLKQTFDNAKKLTLERTGREFAGMLQYDLDNPPKDGEGGWLVALHGSTFQKDNETFLRDTLVYNLARKCERKLPIPGAPAGEAAPAADADPIKGRVTHAFLYNCWTINDPKPDSFEKIKENFAEQIVRGAGGDPSATQTASGGGRDGWKPLEGGGAAASTFGSVGGFSPPVPGTAPVPGRGPGGGRGGDGGRGGEGGRGTPPPPSGLAPPGGPAPGAAPGTPATPGARLRYDFVVMFFWREPTPSDALKQSLPQ